MPDISYSDALELASERTEAKMVAALEDLVATCREHIRQVFDSNVPTDLDRENVVALQLVIDKCGEILADVSGRRDLTYRDALRRAHLSLGFGALATAASTCPDRNPCFVLEELVPDFGILGMIRALVPGRDPLEVALEWGDTLLEFDE